MMRNWVRVYGAACVLAVAVAAGADDKKGDDKKKTDDQKFTDAEFVKKVASDNKLEGELGEIAQLKGARADVKAFGKQMVIDHAKAMNDLREAAKEANLEVPDKMSEKDQKVYEKFKDYKGKDFDQDYMKQMVEDHEKAVDLFTKATKEAKHERVRAYAERYLPAIKTHLDRAKQIRDGLKKE